MLLIRIGMAIRPSTPDAYTSNTHLTKFKKKKNKNKLGICARKPTS